MRFLIDGYNLLHASDLFGEGALEGTLRGSREALLDFLAARLTASERAATVIVFDAADAPAGLPARHDHAEIDVRFARDHADADAMIESLLEGQHRRRGLTVVSGDRRVQRAARRSGARVAGSEQWLNELRSRRAPADERESKRPAEAFGASEDWVNEFDDLVDLGQVAEQAAGDPLPRPRAPLHDEPSPEPPPRPKKARKTRRPPLSQADDVKPTADFGEGLFNPFPPGFGEDDAGSGDPPAAAD